MPCGAESPGRDVARGARELLVRSVGIAPHAITGSLSSRRARRARTSHIAFADPVSGPFVHVIHSPRPTSHKQTP